MKSKTIVPSLLVIVSIVTSLLTSNLVFADAWIGTGGNQPGGDNNNGGGSSSCSSSQNQYTQNCAGKSWLYFEYVGGSALKGKSLSWRNITSGGSEYFKEIPGACSNIGGFWQYGINGQMSYNHTGSIYRMPISNGAAYGMSGSTDYKYYSPTHNTWGHWHMSSPNVLTYGSEKIPGTAGHYVMKKNGDGYTLMYKAKKFALTSNSTLWSNFKDAYHYFNETDEDPSKNDLKNSFAFCYGSVIGDTPKVSTYSASVKAKVESTDGDNSGTYVESTTSSPGESQTLLVTGDSYKLTFTETITRTDSGNFNANNEWKITGGNTGAEYSGNATVSNNSDTLTTKEKKDYTVVSPARTFSGKIYAGQTITYCETLKYDSKVTQTNSSRSAESSSKKACVIIKKTNGVCSTLKGDLQNNVTYSHDNGYNWGQIGVKNLTLGGDYQYYGSNLISGSTSIYARPGDEVVFQHNACAAGFYTDAVRTDATATTTYAPSADSDATDDARVKGNYLFGDEISTWNNSTQSTAPKNLDFVYNTSTNSASDLVSMNIDRTFLSPDAMSTIYNSCLTTGSTQRTAGYYKIAGGTNASTCTNRVQTLDTGHTFSQSLTWTKLGHENGNAVSGGDVSATAAVRVPYNYVTRPYVENKSIYAAYLGEDITMTPGVVVALRKNAAFSDGNNTYATITKPSKIRVKSYFKTASGAIINGSEETHKSLDNVRLNASGNIDGTGTADAVGKTIENNGALLGDVTRNLSDSTLSVGDKVCVEVQIYPRDSHDAPNADTVYGASISPNTTEIALMDSSLGDENNMANWQISTSCSTVSKRPTVSVESSNTYSATGYQAANYTKQLGASGTKFAFGSWSEYGVFGRQTNKKVFASGAALAYSLGGYVNGSGANATRANTEDGNVATSANSGNCTYMTQTFANADCKTGVDSTIGGASATQYSDRMRARFSKLNPEFEETGIPKRTIAGTEYLDLSGYNNADVIAEDGGAVSFNLASNAYINSLPNLTDEQFANKGVVNRNRTIIYEAPNKSIVIDGDINYDNGAKTNVNDISQVVIIAKNVYITDVPTYINAVIIADTVNTCKFAGGSAVAVEQKGGANEINSSMCTRSLRFDAPVIAKKVILNRTGGAGNGIGSIQRAEIFNLSMTNYLWSYSQMSRLSQATTTYSREMPTRY